MTGGTTGARFGDVVAALRVRDFRSLFWAQLASELGDAAGRIALAILILQDSGSVFLSAATVAVTVGPYVGLGQLLTVRFDRHDPKTVLICSDLLRGAAFAAMALPLPVAARFVLLAVAATATPPFDAIRSGITPLTVPERLVPAGVAVVVVTGDVATLVGLSLGGLVTGLLGPATVLALNAATFLLSALQIARVRTDLHTEHDEVMTVRRAWRAVSGDPVVRRMQRFYALAAVGAVAADSLVAALVREELDLPAGWTGALAALAAGGVLVTTAVVRPASGTSRLLRRSSTMALVGASLAGFLLALPPNLAAAAVAYLSVGIVLASRIPLSTVLAQRLDARDRAAVYSILNGTLALASLGSSLLAGATAEVLGPARTIALALAVSALAGLATLLRPPPAQHEVRSRGSLPAMALEPASSPAQAISRRR